MNDFQAFVVSLPNDQLSCVSALSAMGEITVDTLWMSIKECSLWLT